MCYSIVDIETTGGRISENKITEIAIYKINDGKVVDHFSSLVNPGITIPPFIARLTGISNEMVKDAPSFEDVSGRVKEILTESTFVAHNVTFDYGFLKHEFAQIGAGFEMPKICTVKVSQLLLPGQNSYSLGKLSRSLGIKNPARHRATGDAFATMELFKKLLNESEFDSAVSESRKDPIDNLKCHDSVRETIKELPGRTGTFSLMDDHGHVLYIGQARNIRRRIIQLYKRAGGKRMEELLSRTRKISYQIIGSPLLSHIIQTQRIASEKPEYNRKKRQDVYKWGVSIKQSEEGVNMLHVGRLNGHEPLSRHKNRVNALAEAQYIQLQQKLCSEKCLLGQSEACRDHQLGLCRGAGVGAEDVNNHNQRVAISSSESENSDSYLLVEKGPRSDQKTVFFVNGDKVLGHGVFGQKALRNPKKLVDDMRYFTYHPSCGHVVADYLAKNEGSKLQLSA